jgi:hypothetical protein
LASTGPRQPVATPAPSPTERKASWEELYPAAPPEIQERLLTLALKQGLLYSYQLPATKNGAAKPAATRLLSEVLEGKTSLLSPFSAEPIAILDDALDATQREAVVKAVRTPDICLIQGLPGSGKSRVITEIAAQAIALGERVLLLAPTPAAVDHVLERLAVRDGIFSVRCLGRGEAAGTLTPAVSAMIFSARLASLNGKALASARGKVAATAKDLERLRQDQALWSCLEGLARKFERLTEDSRACQASRDAVAHVVLQEADGHAAGEFAACLRKTRQAHDEALAGVDATLAEMNDRIAKDRRDLAELDRQVDEYRRLCAAKQAWRVWSRAWWQASLRGRCHEVLARLESERQQSQAALEADVAAAESLTQQRRQLADSYDSQRGQLITAETTHRQAIQDKRLAEYGRQWAGIEGEWHRLCGALSPAAPRPDGFTLAAISSTRDIWLAKMKQTEEELSFARQWAVQLEKGPETIAGQLPQFVNLVAATPAGLAADAHFGEAGSGKASQPVNFDVLIVDEAEQLTVADFSRLAPRARRWVLVGEPSFSPGAPTRFFDRLWDTLHCDPRRLPYRWFHEGDRLCCRLRHITEEERRGLETESVADSPEIELRILSKPSAQPVLAEIAFPGTTPLDQAKQFVFTQLDELAVRPVTHSLRWLDGPDHIVLRLSQGELKHESSVLLEPGLCEMLGSAGETVTAPGGRPVPFHTCCLEFERAAGWHRARAEEWVVKHLGLRDIGRSVRLDAVYRTEPHLGAFLADTLFSGQQNPLAPPANNAQNGQAPAVEFIAVPPLAARDRPKGVPQPAHFARSSLPSKGGAGLELDLTDARQRERLPADLRADLPSAGFVNLPEANAAVQVLLELAQAPARLPGTDRVAILAVYPAQANLIRSLIARTQGLANPGFALEVGVPGAFCHRETDIVLLSLTRSHTHRAVSFGEGPRALELALTRARSRLIVLGDPGTIIRRSQWEGRVDHLDENLAARERAIIGHLARYLQGNGLHGLAFHFRAGSGI